MEVMGKKKLSRTPDHSITSDYKTPKQMIELMHQSVHFCSPSHLLVMRCRSSLLYVECLLPHEIFVVSQLSPSETCVPAVTTLWSCEVIMSMEAAASSYSRGPSLSNPDH